MTETRPLRPPGSVRRRLVLLAVLVAVIGSPTLVDAGFDGDERVHLEGPVEGDRFVAGAEIGIDSVTVRDLFAAGGEILADGLVADDVTMAAGTLRLRDLDIETLILAGGDVEIHGEVRDHLMAAGGRIELRKGSVVAGYALLAGGKLDLEGRIEGDLKAAGGRIRLAGIVAGDVDLAAGEITLTPTARIGGKLVYRSRSEVEIPPGAVVEGGVERRQVEGFEPSIWLVIGLGIGAWITIVLGLGLLGLLLQGAVPGLVAGATRSLAVRPWPSFGLGFALLVAVPVASSILLFTVVGIPLAFLSYAIFAVLLAGAVVVAAYGLGSRLARAFAWSYEGEGLFRRVLWTFLGLLLLGLIGIVPVLGFLILVVALSLGLGAVTLELWRMTRSWRSVGSAA